MESNILLFMSRLSFLEKLAESLGGDVHKEKEKRVDLLELPKECSGIKPILIKQGVLKEVKKGDRVIAYARVRMKQEPDQLPKYSVGMKNFSKNEESEGKISEETFNLWYPKYLERPQSKKRYKMDNGWTIDLKEDGKITAEYEYKNPDDIEKMPTEWKKA